MASRISSALRERLQRIAVGLKRLIDENAPAHLQGYAQTSVRQEAEAVIIQVRLDVKEVPLEKWGTKDARAQEFGSGLRAQIGETGYIMFGAKNARALVFPGTNAWKGKTIVMMKPRQVMHPGIHAVHGGQGFIRPAIREVEGTLIQQVDATLRDEVNFEFRTWFPHARHERKF